QHEADATAAMGHAELDRTIRFERRAAEQCDVCLAVSEEEAGAARTLLGVDHLEVVPNGVETSYFTPSDEEIEHGSLLFTGAMSYRPNREAVVKFVVDVLPLILRELPHVVLHVVGFDPPPEISLLASPQVVVHGSVPDTRP